MVAYTNASPTSIAVVRGTAWFAYGESVNLKSGVGYAINGRIIDVLRNDGSFIVDRILVAKSTIWFSAFEGYNHGILGVASAKGLANRFSLSGDVASDFTYDGSRDAMTFVRAKANDYGRIEKGRILYCTMPEGPLDKTRALGPTRVAAGGGVLWLYSDVETSMVSLGQGCDRPITVRLPLGGPNAPRNIGRLIVDGTGSAWLLDIKDAAVILADRRGMLRVVHPGFVGQAASIGYVEGKVCIAQHDPALLTCRLNGRWLSRKLPLAGIVSAFTTDRTYLWLAYVRVGDAAHSGVGAIVRVPKKRFFPAINR